jgi:hypothetical protein
MGTGKRRISTAARLEAKVEGGPVLELEHVLVQAELELVLVQVELEHVLVQVVLEHVPVQVELEHVPVAAELALVQAAAVLARELVQVEGVPVPSQPLAQLVEQVRAQLAVALRTKSVTAARRPDLVPLLEAEEDLAAVAETTLEPVAAEAAKAWAAAE